MKYFSTNFNCISHLYFLSNIPTNITVSKWSEVTKVFKESIYWNFMKYCVKPVIEILHISPFCFNALGYVYPNCVLNQLFPQWKFSQNMWAFEIAVSSVWNRRTGSRRGFENASLSLSNLSSEKPSPRKQDFRLRNFLSALSIQRSKESQTASDMLQHLLILLVTKFKVLCKLSFAFGTLIKPII